MAEITINIPNDKVQREYASARIQAPRNEANQIANAEADAIGMN